MNGWIRLAIALGASLLGHWVLSRALDALPRRQAKTPELEVEPFELAMIERVDLTPIAVAPAELDAPPPVFEPVPFAPGSPEPGPPEPEPPAPEPPPLKSETPRPKRPRPSVSESDQRLLEAMRSVTNDALLSGKASPFGLHEPARHVLGDELGLSSVTEGGGGVAGMGWIGSDKAGSPGPGGFGTAWSPADRPERGGVLSAGEVSKLPTVRGECRGQYTEAAREAGIEGTVVLTLVVGPDGATRDVKVVKGLGHGLDAAAVRALERCRFDPGMRDGEAVAVRIPFKVQFRLDE